jgi:hypothetical protein
MPRFRATWLLALFLLAGCTEDVDGVPTATAASPAARPAIATGGQPVATPAPVAPPTARPTPTPATQLPQPIASFVPTPAPATPDPNRPSPTPRPTPRPTPTGVPSGGSNLVPFTQLAIVDVPSFLGYHPGAVRLRTAAEATTFFTRALGSVPPAATTVDYAHQELLALYAPASDDPFAGCGQERLGLLLDQGSTIAFTLALPPILGGCDDTPYPATYQLVTLQRTDKPITGFPEFQP